MILSVGSLLNQSQFHLLVFQSLNIPDLLLRSGDGETLLIEQFFNLQDQIQVFPSIKSLKRSSLMGFDDFEFRFPVAKHMRFETRDAAHLSDPIIEPIIGDRALIFLSFERPDQCSSPPFQSAIRVS